MKLNAVINERMKAQSEVQEYGRTVAQNQARLEQLSLSYDNGKHPEHKDEYEKLKKQVEDSIVTLRSNEAAVNALEEKERELQGISEPTQPNAPSGQPSQSSSNTPIDLTQAGGTQTSPGITVTKPGGTQESGSNEDPEDAGLITPEQYKIATGRTDDGEIVAWKKQGYSKQVIILNGPRNSPRYTLSTARLAGIGFDEDQTPQFGPDHRFGDQKSGRNYVRRYAEFKGVIGVAYSCSLEKLMPRKDGDKRKYPRVEVRVKWNINGAIHRVWEVPSSFKHIFPSPSQCEEWIYITAVDHDTKYQLWLKGQREGRDASPTPAPGIGRLMPKAPQVTGKGIKTENDESSGITSPKVDTEEERMLQFRRQWAGMQKPKLDPENLSMRQQLTFLTAWNELHEEEEL
jgi:hypothetical protein